MGKKDKVQSFKYDNLLIKREQNFHRCVKPIVGIDIGSNTIKIVQMNKQKKIKRYVIERLPVGMVNQGKIEAQQQLADIIKQACRKYRINEKKCALCISANELIVRELVLPEMDENQIFENIKNEITSYLPLNHDEYSIDYKILEYKKLPNNEVANLRIMVAAIPNSIVNKYLNVLKKANLKVQYIDVIQNIDGKLAKWITMNSNTSAKDICIIDFGAYTTNITILNNGKYFINKTIINGSEYLTSLLADKLNIDLLKAEDYKINNDLLEDTNSTLASQLVKNHMDYLIGDIEKTMEFFKNSNNQKSIDQIYVIGGGSMMKGLPKYLERHLGVSVFLLSEALEQFRNGRDLDMGLNIIYHAIGATMREEC